MTSTEMGITANEEKVASGKKTPPAMVMLVGLTAGLGAILILLLMVFILPSLKSGAHDLRVGVVGAPAAVSSFERSLATAAPDAYEPQRYDSEAGLRDAIEHREVVGGFVVDEAGVHTLVASAGSASISGSLTGTAQAVGQATGEKVTVEDVVPLPEGDPTGIGIGGLAFPLVFGGIVPVVAFRKIFPRSNGWYLAGLITFSAVGGVIVASMLTFGFGSIDAGLWSTGFWAVAGSIALGVAALAIPLAACRMRSAPKVSPSVRWS
ncbi:ABC transporter permease [Gordonia sp. C13]|uniref:ABC transporter permease n=1 Tax=Gordonia sp. C13 TaxID=2935078 RepID=UPI00200A2FFE|nr:ABC transporter permease [Gordonia sp. C13]MCK8615739.1 ABC transporter permease [Gordonia sp. C13]